MENSDQGIFIRIELAKGLGQSLGCRPINRITCLGPVENNRGHRTIFFNRNTHSKALKLIIIYLPYTLVL